MVVRRYSCELLFEFVEEGAYFGNVAQAITSMCEGVSPDSNGDAIGQGGKRWLIDRIVTDIHSSRGIGHEGQLPADCYSFIAKLSGKNFPDLVPRPDAEAARR
jgi:hypothetical protein